MTIKPLGDRVLIEALEAETKTKSGIIIPDTAKEKSQEGIVIAIGDGTKKQKMTVKKGDKVLFGKYSGSEIQIDGKKYMIMKETDIYGVLSEEEVKTVVV
ncbi:MAG: chaperonin GroES [Cyclobacteriaceae bacterium]|jgi:chaperonin GroES